MTARPATLDDYRWLYDHGYMPDGLKCAREMLPDIVERAGDGRIFLDYGCGRGFLTEWLINRCRGIMRKWDPARGEEDCPYHYADWVTCFDVLEHIPEAQLHHVLNHIRKIASKGVILAVANMSDVHMVDGEPVELHEIQQPCHWWEGALRLVFPQHQWALIHRHFGHDQRFGFILTRLETA